MASAPPRGEGWKSTFDGAKSEKHAEHCYDNQRCPPLYPNPNKAWHLNLEPAIIMTREKLVTKALFHSLDNHLDARISVHLEVL